MNLSKLIIPIIFIGINSLLSISMQATSLVSEKGETYFYKNTVIEEIGGPRTIIQNVASITIFQPQSTNLYITVLKSNGDILYSVTTNKLSTVISTSSWAAGDYKIVTVDDLGDNQEFYISIN